MMRSYMTDEVQILTSIVDKFNQRTYNSVKVRARVEKKKRWAKDQAGKQTMTAAVVLLELQPITLKDRIKFGHLTWGILTITELKDFSARFLELEVA